MKKKKMSKGVNWRDLPNDLLSIIVDKNTKIADFIRFGAVCVSWRYVYAENQNNIPRQTPPLLILPTRQCNFLYDISEKRVYKTLKLSSLSQNTVCRGSDHGWLVIVSENRAIQLINPLLSLKSTIIKVPPLPCSDNKASGFSTSYLRKAVLSANPSENPNFIVMALHNKSNRNGYGGTTTTLSFWRNGDRAWTGTPINRYNYLLHDIYTFDDFIYYKEKFCALMQNGRVSVFDISGVSVGESVIEAFSFGFSTKRKYLVKSGGELLMIIKQSSMKYEGAQGYRESTDGFRVFKLDEIKNRWIEVSDLDERILFIGDHFSSFSSSTSDMPGCKANDIYFIFNGRESSLYYDEIGVFNLKDCSIKPLYPLRPIKMATTLAPIFMQPTFHIKKSSQVSILERDLSKFILA